MTWLLMMILGLATTGLMYPNYEWVTQTVNTNEQIIQLYEDEMQRNFMAEQEEIIIEDYFLFLDKIGKIRYARWCMGEYTPPVRSEENQKRVKCSDNAFDCAGLVKAYGIAKGIITEEEATHYNSQSLMSLAQSKHATLAQRGDRTSRQGYGERSTGNLSTHFAMISRDYTGGNTLWVYDNVNGPSNNKLGERPLSIALVGSKFHYMGKYRITVYTNGYVEKTQKEWITIERRYDTESQEETWHIDTDNPLGFSVTLSTFDYDSIANRVVSYRYDNNPDKKDAINMISTMIQENWGFDINSWSPTRDSGLCQLHYNDTNKIWIDDPRRKTWEFQAQVCLNKWLIVKDKNLWEWYKIRTRHTSKIILQK